MPQNLLLLEVNHLKILETSGFLDGLAKHEECVFLLRIEVDPFEQKKSTFPGTFFVTPLFLYSIMMTVDGPLFCR